MKRFPYLAAFALASLGAILSAGCGGSGTTINIEIQPSGASSSECTGSTTLSCSLDVGGTINFTALVGGDTSGKGVTWKLTGTTCAGTPATGCGTLSNMTNSSVTYTAPTGISSAISGTLTATSVARTSVTQTVTINIVLAPTFSAPCVSTAATCPLANGANGVPYSQTLTITGGVAPYTYSVISGAQSLSSECLSLNGLATGTTNTIVGTPCSSGKLTFTVQVQDSGGIAPITQTFSISVTPPPPLSITTSSLPQGFVNVNYNAFITAQGGVAPLTWSLVGGGTVPVPGLGLTLNLTNGQITGVPTMPGTFTFQVTVRDSSLPAPGQTAGPMTISITTQTPPLLSITTPSLPLGAVATAYAGSLQATGGIGPYTWKIIQGLLPSGLTLATLSNSTGNISGTPVLATSSTFTVQVTDSEVVPVTKTASFSITINAGSANTKSLLNGSYGFLFQGFDSDGSVAIAGTLVADGNGNVTSGSEDSNRVSGVVTGITLTGTYTIGTDGTGTMELTATSPQNVQLIIDYQLVLDSSGNAQFFEDNATGTNTDKKGTHGEGILKPLAGSTFSAGSFSGNYAFEFSGQDSSGKKEALAGVVQANGSETLNNPIGTAVNSDINDAGTYSSQSISGNFSVGMSSNRGAATFVYAPPMQSQISLTFVFYFVSPSDLFFVEIDTTDTQFPNPPRLSGEMILQNPGVTFGPTSLAGASVASGSGVDGSNASVFAGLLAAPACDGSTAVSFNYDQNDGGTVTAPSFSGTCMITSSGRTAFTNIGTRAAVAYLVGQGQGFLLGSDAAVTTGFLEEQSDGPFADSSVQGGYTLSAPFAADNRVPSVLGQLNADGIGDVTGTINEVDSPGTPAHLAQSAIVKINSLASSGRGIMTANPLTGFPTNLIFYVVSPASSRAISADPGGAHPQVFLLDY
ncbi:MAG: Ig domain-containing protein [Candidatus Acidiferrales bacterium]|jgi:hypothetical protein